MGFIASITTLSTVFTVLSLLALFKYSLGHGFTATVEEVIRSYESVTRIAFSWAEPIITQIVIPIGRAIGVTLTIYPHWKHVFVILMILVGAVLRVTRDGRSGLPSRSRFAIYCSAVFVTLICSAFVGSVNRDVAGEEGDIFIASFPIAFMVGAFVFLIYVRSGFENAASAARVEYLERFFSAFLPGLILVVIAFFISLLIAHAVSFVIFKATTVQESKNPGVVVLGVWIIGIASIFMMNGIMKGAAAFKEKYTEKDNDGHLRYIKRYGHGSIVEEVYVLQLITRPILLYKFLKTCWRFREFRFSSFVLFSFFSALVLAAATAGQNVIGST